jgi:hypothetical protein
LGTNTLTASSRDLGISSDIEWIFLGAMAVAAVIGVAYVWRKPYDD